MANDLTEDQADELAGYLLRDGDPAHGWYAIQLGNPADGFQYCLGRRLVGILYSAESWRDVFHLAGEDLPERDQFREHGKDVVRGVDFIATCRSRTMAQRVAAALNWYKPGARGY